MGTFNLMRGSCKRLQLKRLAPFSPEHHAATTTSRQVRDHFGLKLSPSRRRVAVAANSEVIANRTEWTHRGSSHS